MIQHGVYILLFPTVLYMQVGSPLVDIEVTPDSPAPDADSVKTEVFELTLS